MGFSLDIVPPGTEEENSTSPVPASAVAAATAPMADRTEIILIDRNPQNNINDEDSEREEGEIIESLEYEDISSDEEINLRQRIEELEARNLEYEKIAKISTGGEKTCDFDYGISNYVDLVDSSSDNEQITDTNNYSTNYIYNGSNNSASRYQNYHQYRSITTHKKSSRRKKDKQASSSTGGGGGGTNKNASIASTSHHKHDRKKSRHSTNTNSTNSSNNNFSTSNKHKHSSNLNTIDDADEDDYVYGNSNKSYHRTSNKSRNHTIRLNSSSDDTDDYENDSIGKPVKNYYQLKDDTYLSTSNKDDFRPRRNVLRAALKGSLSVANNDNSSSLLKKLRGVQNCVKEFIKIKSKEDHDKEETATSIEIMQLLNTLTDQNLLNGQHQSINEQQEIIIDDSQDDRDDDDDDDNNVVYDDSDNIKNNRKKKYKSSSPLTMLHQPPPPPPPLFTRPSINETISLEEQELRLIALKSAILKKHEQRKKRKIIEQQRPYSPTDTDNFINLLDSSKNDLANKNEQHNEDNFKIAQIENMDISPAVSPIYTIDMSLQPIDMELASSSDNDDDDDDDDKILQTPAALSPQPSESMSLQSQHQMVNDNSTSWDIMTILPPPPPPPPLPPLPIILNDISSYNLTEHQSTTSSLFSQQSLFKSSLSTTILSKNSSIPPPPPPPPLPPLPFIPTMDDKIDNDDEEEENALRQLLLTTTRSLKIRKIDSVDKKPKPKLQTEKLIVEDEQKTLDISFEAEELRKLLLKSLSNKKDEQKENVARINNIPNEQIKDISTLKDHQILQNKKLISTSTSSSSSSSSSSSNSSSISSSSTSNNSTITTNTSTTTTTATVVANTITTINTTKKLLPLINQKENKQQIVSKNNATTTTAIIKPIIGQKRLAISEIHNSNLLVVKKQKLNDIKQNQRIKSKLITSLEVKIVPKMIIRLDNSDSDTDFNDSNDEDINCVDNNYFDNASPVSLSMDSPANSARASPITVLPSNTSNENNVQLAKTGGSIKSTNDLSTAILFQQQLDKFLKIARTKVEKNKITTTVPNKSSTITNKNILTTKSSSSKIITIPKTPQVVQHLPFSSQIEYHRLINRISLLEKQKKAKLKVVTPAATVIKKISNVKNIHAVKDANEIATATTTFQNQSETNATLANDNLCNNNTLTIAENTELLEKISTNVNKKLVTDDNVTLTTVSSLINQCTTSKTIAKLPEIDKKSKTNTENVIKKEGEIIKTEKTIIKKLSPSKLSIDPMNLSTKDRTELLTKSESQYSDQSSTFLNDLDTMYKLVSSAQKTRTNIFNLEEEKEELLSKLKKLDENLIKEKKHLSKLYPTIAGSHRDILRDRTKCIKLSNSCLTMGKLLHGSGYKIPHDKRDILLDKMKKISEATKKLKTMNKNDLKMIVISDVNVKNENPVDVQIKNNEQIQTTESIPPKQLEVKEKEIIVPPTQEIQNNGDINMETSTTTTTTATTETLSADQLNDHHPDDEVIDELTTGMSTYKSPLDYKQQSSSANPNGVICPFQLMGQCEDKDCRYEHIPTTTAANDKNNDDDNDDDVGNTKATATTITPL